MNQTDRRRKWQIDFEFFETWTWQLAYWLGLMITDGCVASHTDARGNHDLIIFSNTEKELVEFIRACVCPQQKMIRQKNPGKKDLYWWRACSAELAAKLIEFGIVPRKSLTAELPKVPKEFEWDLVRGVLDGDGTLDKRGRISFCSASPKLLNQLAQLFETQAIHSLTYKKQNYFILMLSKDNSSRLAQLIYCDNRFCLQRKKNRARIQYNIPF